MLEEERLLQENANLAVISKLINSSLNKTVQDTIIAMLGEMKENDAILVTNRIPLICERIATILKNQELAKISLDKKEDDHEVRLRSLEKNMWRSAGIASILGALGMWALDKFV